jgi:short-subunit dehydrogenase
MKKTALITGSSKGLGKALAFVFAKNNYDIILQGRDKMDLYNIANEIKTKTNIVIGDLKQDKTLNELYEVAKKEDISVLVNNAATLCPKLPLEELTDKQIEDMVSTNLISPIKLTKRIYTLFLKKQEGTIININSISGLEAQNLRSIYCSSKSGLRSFTDTLRLESKNKGINIIGIYPGKVQTKPEHFLGIKAPILAEKIYETYKNNLNELIISDKK